MFDWLSNSTTVLVVGTWLAAFGTLAIYSILYKENPVYRMAEHIFIGGAAGYLVYIAWAQTLKPQWWDKITQGQWYWVFALVAGSMFYFVYSQKHAWISKLIFGALLGLVSGMAFKGFAGTNIDQMYASFKPIAGVPVGEALNNLLFVAILLTVMSYFFFSFEHKTSARRTPATVGRWVLMFAFGAMFGSTVMARMSLLIGRIHFLLSDWLGIAT